MRQMPNTSSNTIKSININRSRINSKNNSRINNKISNNKNNRINNKNSSNNNNRKWSIARCSATRLVWAVALLFSGVRRWR